MDITRYDYHLPESLIALQPAEPRDSCRLFVYDTVTDTVQMGVFAQISEHITSRSLLVLNQTRVLPARLTLLKSTGGKVVCLFLLNEIADDPGDIHIMVDRRVSPDDVLSVSVSGGRREVLKVANHRGGGVFVAKLCMTRRELLALMQSTGSLPLPPYLSATSLSQQSIREKYQTVFSRSGTHTHSVAAPTAGLHFTPELLKVLESRGVRNVTVDLGIGLGTFAPLNDSMVRRGKLHAEWYKITHRAQQMIEETKKRGDRIIAVGTTVVRALESQRLHVRRNMSPEHGYNRTELFIREGFSFRYTDELITNFHLPRSSLLMLVDAFLAYKGAKRSILELYRIAIEHGFKFYSFGDAMYIRS